MTTLGNITTAAKKINSYQRVHGRSTELERALKHLRIAYAIVRDNGGK